MNIGQKIKERREELGLTQEELARILGYASRSSVNKVETSREVSMKKIKLYADALQTTVAYLMGWEQKQEIEEKADTDIKLILARKELKECFLKIIDMPKDKQDKIISLIDMI